MTPIEYLKKLHSEATPGYWESDGGIVDCIYDTVIDTRHQTVGKALDEFDAKLIATTHNILPAVIRYMEVMRDKSVEGMIWGDWYICCNQNVDGPHAPDCPQELLYKAIEKEMGR